MNSTKQKPQGWRCKPEDRQNVIEFALALEENENHAPEHAAMAMTCEQFGLDVTEGYDLLMCLPDYGHADQAWWLQDNRAALSKARGEKE